MERILDTYKDRLINLSAKNNSLVLKKLYKKRNFDISLLREFDENICNSILEYISNPSRKNIKIVEDYLLFYSKEVEVVEKIFREKLRDVKEEIKAKNLNNEDFNIEFENKKEKLQQSYGKEKEIIEKKRDALIDYGQHIKALNKEIGDIIKETGKKELYIGYPFIEGKFKDGTFFKAPLLLFQVSLEKEGDSWFITSEQDNAIIMNKVFLLAIEKYNEVKVNFSNESFTSINNNIIDEILSELSNYGLFIEKNFNEVEKFKEYTVKNIPNYGLGNAKLVSNIILGQFPLANSIYNDYESLIKNDMNNELLNGLLKTEYNKERLDSYEEKEENGKLSFSEKDIYLISQLDYSQELVVNKANKNNMLVVYGPPGTGKSQTITNIISDALAKDKKVLMVSQKRAALDVIFNRLGDLNSKAVIIHDANGDKKSFYSLVANSINTNKVENKDYLNSIIKISTEVDNKIKNLESLAKTLCDIRSYGLNLQEMYSKCKDISSKDDPRFDEFIKFRALDKEKGFDSFTYKELVSEINKVDEKLILAFKRYKDLSDKNNFIDDIDLDMNLMDIEEFSMKVKNIIKPIEHIVNEKNKSEDLYEAIMNIFKENNYNIKEDKLKSLAETINKNNNGELTKQLNTGKWWSISYWLNYSANKKKYQENLEEFKRRYNTILNDIIKMAKEIKLSFDDIAIIKKALNNRVYDIVLEMLINGENLTEYFNEIIDALHLVNDFKDELKLSKSVTDIQSKLLNYSLDKNVDTSKKKINEVLEFSIIQHILELEKLDEVQHAIKYLEMFDDIVTDANDKMKLKQEAVKKFIINKWNKKIQELITNTDFKEFKRQSEKKRALWPIRKYVEEYGELLLNIFPCFLLSPETVSDILPLKEGLFDVVIFDEASQMYIESAIPTIYRGKQIVVAGDDKQLRPNGTFKSSIESDSEGEEQSVLAALEEESLLDLAKVNYEKTHLTYHYRSQYEELISFSNAAFYGGRLKISPNLIGNKSNEKPIERIMCNGRWIDRANEEEANEVVNLVYALLKERKNNETVGIITFNISQKSLIENMLERKAQDDSEFRDLYVKEIDRVEDNEDVSLFVKNIENVQGDERDIIIFSIGYGKNENNRVSVNFGSLSQDSGENRLNVAISRAKKKIYVVTSIEPEELSVDNSKNNGPKLFKKYLQYVRGVSNGNKEEVSLILNSLLDSEIRKNEERNHDSDFEAEVYDELTKKGYEVHCQIGVSGYKIDLAIYDKKQDKYILGIECDGATYHSSKSARERDIHRQRYLESRGWNIIRIWSKHWWNNKIIEIRRIEDRLNTLN